MRAPLVLRLASCGTPISWLRVEDAACLIVKGDLCWELGGSISTLKGGFSNLGIQSSLSIPAIIATKGALKSARFVPQVSNRLLFRRDNNVCLYCGNQFESHQLSRDHIFPKSLGGKDTWTNLATACKRCNHRKGARTPEKANMQLLAVPFVPNVFEYTALQNRRILSDQMEFLKGGFSSKFKAFESAL